MDSAPTAEIAYQPDMSVPLDGAARPETAAEETTEIVVELPDGGDSPDLLTVDGAEAQPPEDDEAEGDEDDAPVEAAGPAEDLAALRAEAARARQYDEFMAQQQRIAQQRATEAQWAQQEAQADAYYDQQINIAYRQSLNAVDQEAYWQQHGVPQIRAKDNWHRQFDQSKAQRWQEVAAAMAVPQYAAQVAQQAGLGQDAVAELLEYPPDLIPREAARMRRERDEKAQLKKQATQARRKLLAQQVAATTVAPGSGRAASVKRTFASPEELYSDPTAMRWERRAPGR